MGELCVSVIVTASPISKDDVAAALPLYPLRPHLLLNTHTHTHTHSVNPTSLILMGQFPFPAPNHIVFTSSLSNGRARLSHAHFFFAQSHLPASKHDSLTRDINLTSTLLFSLSFSIRQGSIIKTSSQLLRIDKL